MISIRKYLDGVQRVNPVPNHRASATAKNLAAVALRGYVSALQEMGRCGADVCPALGHELYESLSRVAEDLSRADCAESVAVVDQSVRGLLEDWGLRSARHYQKKAAEVKDILLVMARTAESVGESDQRCAQQINEVTTKLKGIADLDDLTQIRASIEKSAADLKSSIARLTTKAKPCWSGCVTKYQRTRRSSRKRSRLPRATRCSPGQPIVGRGADQKTHRGCPSFLCRYFGHQWFQAGERRPWTRGRR